MVVDEVDETLAVAYRVPLLISASSRDELQRVARRIHRASVGESAPFVEFTGGAFPAERQAFITAWLSLLQRAAGGTLFVPCLEDVHRSVQDLLAESLGSMRVATPARARFIAGTTVGLMERVHAGTYSDRLFYGVNTIHLNLRS
jgi:DNA-binding NtrC family response regulator